MQCFMLSLRSMITSPVFLSAQVIFFPFLGRWGGLCFAGIGCYVWSIRSICWIWLALQWYDNRVWWVLLLCFHWLWRVPRMRYKCLAVLQVVVVLVSHQGYVCKLFSNWLIDRLMLFGRWVALRQNFSPSVSRECVLIGILLLEFASLSIAWPFGVDRYTVIRICQLEHCLTYWLVEVGFGFNFEEDVLNVYSCKEQWIGWKPYSCVISCLNEWIECMINEFDWFCCFNFRFLTFIALIFFFHSADLLDLCFLFIGSCGNPYSF